MSLTHTAGFRRKYPQLQVKIISPRGLPHRAKEWGSSTGFVFPNLPLRLFPVLNCSPVLAASLLVQFIGTRSDLRGYIERFPGHRVGNAPFDHRDLDGVVQNQA